MTKASNKLPTPLTDDHPTYLKALSVMAGLKEVRNELSEEARVLLENDKAAAKSSNRVIWPQGYGERVALIEALDDAYKTAITDMRRAARSSGLGFPEDLR